MTGGTNRGLEDLLHDRLHEVDAMDPPEPDFEFRALRAGRERLKRRQSWRRGLVGAAAAVAVGAVAVPALSRVNVSSGGGSSAGGVSATQDRQSAQAPTEGDAGKQGADQAAPGAASGGAATSGLVGVVVPYAGSTAVDWGSAQGQAAVEAARSVLTAQYAAIFTALSVDRSTTPPRLVVHLTRFDDAALRAVVAQLPPDAAVGYALSAYSAPSCAATLGRVETDRPRLEAQGSSVAATRCDDDGRVLVEVTNLVTAEQIRALEVPYNGAVRVVQAVPSPPPSSSRS